MVAFRFTLLLLLCGALRCPVFAQNHTAADLGRAVLSAGLDSSECYRVRDLQISEDDAQFFLTDGYLIFGKPVNGSRLTAVFTAEVEGGDAEVLLLPPNRSERRSLAFYTHSPNLDEHFTNAVFLFSDGTATSLLDQIRTNENKKAADIGVLMGERWEQVVRNLSTSFESRLVLDLLTPGAKGHGFFGALIKGKNLGNFDVLFDSRGYEQIVVGQVTTRQGVTYWDTWTSFPSRTRRGAPAPESEQQILSYAIEASLDSSLTLRCVTRMRIKATDDARNVIPLDLAGQMRATEAKVDGQPAEVYQRDSVRNGLVQNSGNELLLVMPSQSLSPGSEHEIEIHHEGKVILDAGRHVYFVSARGSWYPSRGAQFARYDATFRYPKGLDLIAAGEVKEDRVEGSLHVTRWVADGKVRLLGFNLGEYQRKIIERGDIAIEVCANRQSEQSQKPPPPLVTIPPPPAVRSRRLTPNVSSIPDLPAPSAASALDNLAADVASSVEFFRARFGDPPLRRIAVSPVPGRFGQGFAGMIYLSTLSYLSPASHEMSSLPGIQQIFFTTLLSAHEAAHQWWGNIVTSASYHHEWLMEALANYSALLYIESHKGPKVLEMVLDRYRKDLLAKGTDGETVESIGPVVQGRRLESSSNPKAWTAVVYGKGTWIMHMLHRRMGDAQFAKMLGELRRRYEWKPIDTEQFRALASEFLPAHSPDPKLEAFFDEWVYGTGIPSLKLTYTIKGKPGAYKLAGTITQSDVPEDYSVMVPIEIQTGRAKAIVQNVRTSSEPVSFSVAVASANAKAILDPGWSVLRR